MKKLNYFSLILISFLFVGLIFSCGVSSGETLKAGRLPILQVCPLEQDGPSMFDFFVDPVFVEEASNNIIVVDVKEGSGDVYLNSIYMGKSKISITDLVPGQYILDIKKAGYEDIHCFINVSGNRKNYYEFNLNKLNQ